MNAALISRNPLEAAPLLSEPQSDRPTCQNWVLGLGLWALRVSNQHPGKGEEPSAVRQSWSWSNMKQLAEVYCRCARSARCSGSRAGYPGSISSGWHHQLKINGLAEGMWVSLERSIPSLAVISQQDGAASAAATTVHQTKDTLYNPRSEADRPENWPHLMRLGGSRIQLLFCWIIPYC